MGGGGEPRTLLSEAIRGAGQTPEAMIDALLPIVPRAELLSRDQKNRTVLEFAIREVLEGQRHVVGALVTAMKAHGMRPGDDTDLHPGKE